MLYHHTVLLGYLWNDWKLVVDFHIILVVSGCLEEKVVLFNNESSEAHLQDGEGLGMSEQMTLENYYPFS